MNTRDIRETFNWSQKQMADITGIPLRTIENWDYRDNMKDWLHDYIYRSELANIGFSRNDRLGLADLEEERKEEEYIQVSEGSRPVL